MDRPYIPPSAVPGLMHPDLYNQDPNVKAANALTHNCVQKTILSGVMGFGMGGLFGGFMASMAYDTPFQTPPAAAASAATPAASATAATTAGATTSTAASPTTTAPGASTSPRSLASNSSPPVARAAATTVATATAPSHSTLPSASSITPTTKATTTTTTSPPSLAAATTTPTAVSAPIRPATASMYPPPIAALSTRQTVINGFRDMGSRSYGMAKSFGKVGAIFSGIECSIEGLRGRNDFTNGVAAGCLTGGILAMNAGPLGAASGCAAFAAFSAAIEAWIRSPNSEY